MQCCVWLVLFCCQVFEIEVHRGNVSIHSASGCFQGRAHTNSAAVNVLVHNFGWTNAHVGVAHTPGNGIAESWGRRCAALVDSVLTPPSWLTLPPPRVRAPVRAPQPCRDLVGFVSLPLSASWGCVSVLFFSYCGKICVIFKYYTHCDM